MNDETNDTKLEKTKFRMRLTDLKRSYARIVEENGFNIRRSNKMNGLDLLIGHEELLGRLRITYDGDRENDFMFLYEMFITDVVTDSSSGSITGGLKGVNLINLASTEFIGLHNYLVNKGCDIYESSTVREGKFYEDWYDLGHNVYFMSIRLGKENSTELFLSGLIELERSLKLVGDYLNEQKREV